MCFLHLTVKKQQFRADHLYGWSLCEAGSPSPLVVETDTGGWHYVMQSPICFSISLQHHFVFSTHSPHTALSQWSKYSDSPPRKSFSQNWNVFSERCVLGVERLMFIVLLYRKHLCMDVFFIWLTLMINFQWERRADREIWGRGLERQSKTERWYNNITSCDYYDAVSMWVVGE